MSNISLDYVRFTGYFIAIIPIMALVFRCIVGWIQKKPHGHIDKVGIIG